MTETHTDFHGFLRARLAGGGFATADCLASVLPLMRETLEAHAAGKVAPLEGLDALHVEDGRIWFEQAKRQPMRENRTAVERLAIKRSLAVEVIAEAHRTVDIDDGSDTFVDATVGQRGQDLVAPVYLPGYVSWEHELQHHDPLTDVFSLGLILTSLACGLDFTDREDLLRFVASRRNLFALNRDLHPVLAQAIVRMTELDRHRRAQDLAALIRNLENYREQDVDFDFELARLAELAPADPPTKQHAVLTKLRERLFEISRRNRLLNFRPTMQTVNLTHASVPLSFDHKSIQPEQILVWTDDLQQTILRSGSLSLNRYLNFNEALYLPGVLDHLAAEARRDQAEFGFAQLRLVICFLHWFNLKESPPERFESPLVLLPVELKKKKGIRDQYVLELLSSEAEINPVIRHHFRELYGILLPETIELATTTLDSLYELLSAQIQASEPAVTLERIDRPRIAVIHERARRRMDQYRQRARLAGRGVRSYLELDYSYDPANYHPLGLTLFQTKIRPPATHLREIIEEKPRPRSYASPPETPPAVEVERTFYALQTGGTENPYQWSFDRCGVTLANFKYRKMSLVRDYEALLEQPRDNAAFDATFSLVPRNVERSLPAAAPLEDRYDVVPCDPTQSIAIEEARAGLSYIIQGPPGTGKSQTITNLIADFAAHGKRVLFVCEKRAAIDVVYARLRQCGLAESCCLIHDSQTDKRGFVMDLKQTYEAALADAENQLGKKRRTRTRGNVLKRLLEELTPLMQFDAAMHVVPERSAITTRQLLERCIELHAKLPELTPIQREQLPAYADWWQHRELLGTLDQEVREFQREGILARHALAILSPRVALLDRPLYAITQAVRTAESWIPRLIETLEKSETDRANWETLAATRLLVAYAAGTRPLAEAGQVALLDKKSERVGTFSRELQKLRARAKTFDQASGATGAWIEKLPPDALRIAWQQAQRFEHQWFPWLHPAWWRLRAVLKRSYNFQAHVVQPTWTQVLSALDAEYHAAAERDYQQQRLAESFQIDGDVDAFVERLTAARKLLSKCPTWLADFHRDMLRSKKAPRILAKIERAGQPLERLDQALSQITDDCGDLTLDQLKQRLGRISAALDDLPDYLRAMEQVGNLPDGLQSVMRRMPLAVPALEAAVADATLREIYRQDRALERFHGTTRQRHVERIETLYDQWLNTNADEIRRRLCDRFLDHVRTASLPNGQLDAGQKEFKKRYNRGRREVEHEFGKSMRYKAIRELVSGDSGEVIKDLKPVWLMSPLSVSDTLPMDTQHFDVVIFDEASQVTLEEAVPSIFRAAQAIVVGDEMQLPPTDFFSARRSGEEDELMIDDQGELVRYDLNSNSFLNHAAKNLPSTMLGWHYRSRSEALISFSNWTFYDGRLLTVPDQQLLAAGCGPIKATCAEDGLAGAEALVQRPVSFHCLQHGVYEKRRNRAEADYIAHLVRQLLAQGSGSSIGIVAFSEAQQNEIESALARLAQQDREFAARLDAEFEREVDGQFVGLLVKNLENIQGDERDIVILSVCYGPGPDGRMLMNFGPINQSGGEKRLNVAFSRAKHHMAVVSSIRYAQITNEYNDGANCLRNYLRYAQAVSEGDGATAGRVLRGVTRWRDQDEAPVPEEAATNQIAAALTERGLIVDRSVGQSHFRCDLAVRRPEDTAYRLGILVDGPTYYEQDDVLERDMMRPRLLRTFGWKLAFVLSKDWYEDRTATLDRLLQNLS